MGKQKTANRKPQSKADLEEAGEGGYDALPSGIRPPGHPTGPPFVLS